MVWVLRGDQRRTGPICEPPATRPHRGKVRARTRGAWFHSNAGGDPINGRRLSAPLVAGERDGIWPGTPGSHIEASACSPHGTHDVDVARWRASTSVQHASCSRPRAKRPAGSGSMRRGGRFPPGGAVPPESGEPIAALGDRQDGVQVHLRERFVAQSAPAALCRSNVRSGSFALAHLASLQGAIWRPSGFGWCSPKLCICHCAISMLSLCKWCACPHAALLIDVGITAGLQKSGNPHGWDAKPRASV